MDGFKLHMRKCRLDDGDSRLRHVVDEVFQCRPAVSELVGRWRHERCLIGAMATAPHLIAAKFARAVLHAPARRHQHLMHFRQQSKTDGLPLPYPFQAQRHCLDVAGKLLPVIERHTRQPFYLMQHQVAER